jgi:DNA (cytosine-5)-methyltransferase 3A
VEPILINSALVSAQNRNRLYWTNIPGVTQPEDKGIMLRDILETGTAWREKSYTLDAHYHKTAGEYNPKKQHSYSRHMAAEPVNITVSGKAYAIKAQYAKTSTACLVRGGGHFPQSGVIEPYDYTPREGCDIVVSASSIRCTAKNGKGMSQGYTVMYPEGKAATVASGQASKMKVIETAPTGKTKSYPVYEVRDGQITIKDKQYPIKLPDGYYIIRKLTVRECMRLQTVPEDYIFPVSNTQAYKMLGNGWTVDVIAHILSHIPMIDQEEVVVMSMYDGMSCGHIALDKLNANITQYCATEIDQYAIKTSQANFPDIIHLGDAYQVREDQWRYDL